MTTPNKASNKTPRDNLYNLSMAAALSTLAFCCWVIFKDTKAAQLPPEPEKTITVLAGYTCLNSEDFRKRGRAVIEVTKASLNKDHIQQLEKEIEGEGCQGVLIDNITNLTALGE